MGRFIYDGTVRVEFEDRTLLHLQTVIGTKLRRGEAFFFSWREDALAGGGRTSVWIHPHARLMYQFFGSRQATLNRDWLDALTYTANSSSGLYVVPEQNAGRASQSSPLSG